MSFFLQTRDRTGVVAVRLLLVAFAACSTETEQPSKINSSSAIIASCSDMAYHEREECNPDLDIQNNVEQCERLRLQYEPLGCGEELATFVDCYTNARLNCETGYPDDCPGSEVYGQCVSAFTARTLCSRDLGEDGECEAGLFFFNCIDTVPDGCTVLGPSSLGSSVCCPSFETSGEIYFKEPMLAPEDLDTDAGR